MRLEDEFAAIRAEEDRQRLKETAVLIAREHNLPDSDSDVLLSYSQDERMMRVLANRLGKDARRPVTTDQAIRLSVPHPMSVPNGPVEEDVDPLGSALDQGLRKMKRVGGDFRQQHDGRISSV